MSATRSGDNERVEIRVRLEARGRQRLRAIGTDLATLESLLNFAAEMSALARVVKEAQETRGFGTSQLEALWGTRQTRARLATSELIARLSDSKPGARPSVVVDWWLGLPHAAGTRLVRPMPVRSVSYGSPIEVIVVTAAIVAQSTAWVIAKVQEAQLRHAEAKKARAETMGLQLDNLKKVAELAEAYAFTEDLIKELVPGLSQEAVNALMLSEPTPEARQALKALPRIGDVEVLEPDP